MGDVKMNLKVQKKVLALAATASLLSSVSIPGGVSLASNASPSQPSKQTVIQNQGANILKVKAQETLKNIDVSSVKLLDSYISILDNGLLQLDEAGKEVVSPELYDFTASGISMINSSIQAGSVKVDAINKRIVPVAVDNNAGERINPSAFGNVYWWGVAFTMSEAEAKSFAYSLEQVKDTFAAVAIVSAAIGGIMGVNPAPWAASAAAAIVALGAGLVSRSLTYYNNPNGVTLNIHWLPVNYYEVTKNS